MLERMLGNLQTRLCQKTDPIAQGHLGGGCDNL